MLHVYTGRLEWPTCRILRMPLLLIGFLLDLPNLAHGLAPELQQLAAVQAIDTMIIGRPSPSWC